MFEWEMRRLDNAGKRLDIILQQPEKSYDMVQRQIAEDELALQFSQQIANNPGMLSIGY